MTQLNARIVRLRAAAVVSLAAAISACLGPAATAQVVAADLVLKNLDI